MAEKFSLSEKSITPISIWFVYGGNLNLRCFTVREKGADSRSSLLPKEVGELTCYRMVLGSSSELNCLEYTIVYDQYEHTTGLILELHADDLRSYLQIAGVLSSEKEINNDQKRRWDVIRARAISQGLTVNALTLITRSSSSLKEIPKDSLECRKKLFNYVRMAHEGASSLGMIQDHSRKTWRA